MSIVGSDVFVENPKNQVEKTVVKVKLCHDHCEWSMSR